MHFKKRSSVTNVRLLKPLCCPALPPIWQVLGRPLLEWSSRGGAAFGAASPFWPKFFETRALAAPQIGLILAAAMLTRLVCRPEGGQ
jgi:hypothetical protein